VDVRRDQLQQQLQVSLHEVLNDLVLRLRVVDLRILRTGARSLRGQAPVRVFNAPSVLGQVVTLLCRKLRLGRVELDRDVQCKAADINLVILKRNILIRS
jgi:hypothetical protein